MRRTKRLNAIIRLTMIVALAAQIRVAGVVAAEAASAPSLVISQLKITSGNGQFITLYNATSAPLDMGKFQLEYFNNYDLAKATSSKLISLAGMVPPHGYYKVSDDSFLVCHRQTVDSVALGLSSTAGLVEVLSYEQAAPGASAAPVLQDFVGWSKSAASGAQTLPASPTAFLARQPVAGNGDPQINEPGAGSWQNVQPGDIPCSLVAVSDNKPVAGGSAELLPATEPAATILSAPAASATDSSVRALPPGDAGLIAPAITELLPNPAGTGNDSTDEFIEIYNPNPVSFDLSGFVLQTGSTSFHNYTFPAETALPPQSFTAFYSSSTGLSLSNSGGQVRLLDPAGKQVSTIAAYGKAGDGLAWALANGHWYWTARLTPAAPNIVDKPPVKTKSAASKQSKAKSIKPAVGQAAAKKVKTALASSGGSAPATTPIHTSALAAVAGLALLYGAYEYRADLANRFYQLKRYLKLGGGNGQQVTGRRGD